MNPNDQEQYERFIVPELQRESAERLARLEARLLGGVIGERLDRLEAMVTGNRTGFIPDQEDMEFLAYAYLDKAMGLHCYYFFTGACDGAAEAMRLEARFEDVAKYLGQAKRQEIIDLVDKRGYETSGDEWEAFKSTAEGFWSTPADREAILRLAASLPDDLSQLATDVEYYEVLEQARGGRKPEEEDSRDVESENLDPVDPEKMN